jgi:predicted alpha-1,2-mannosidase
MKNKMLLFMAALLLSSLSIHANSQEDFTQFVDPHIGSGGHGHVFVGACVPFSSLQLGPNNMYQGWDWCSGYHYSDLVITGFSHTHLSGTGCSDMGDIILMPYSGNVRTVMARPDHVDGTASSTFSHSNEKVAPGYYSVKLDNGVNVELSSTARVGIHHYTYTTSGEHRLLIDLENGIGNSAFESYIKKIDDHTIEGYRFVHGWAPTHKVFFYARFNQPIKELLTFKTDTQVGKDELKDVGVKGVATFGSDINDVMAKVAISSVSCENAKMNMNAEMPGWDFASVRRAAHDQWNKELSAFQVQGEKREKTIFYTALFHAFISPTLYCDVNGDFLGIDGKIHTGNKFKNYTTFSTWDTYRTLHPMYTLIQKNRVNDFINSFLSIYDQNGYLPIWPLYSGETNCMPGYSSVPILADAYLKGIRGYDTKKALNYMISTANNDRLPAIKLLKQYGYIPCDKHGEATSISLEYAADDRGIALMAKQMGRIADYKHFLQRSNVYQKYFDKSILKVHPKKSDGSWFMPYDPFYAGHTNSGADFTEGNGWEYTFMVPQDPEGLIALHGGDQAFCNNLDSLFVVTGEIGKDAPPDVSGLIGMYAHGNEPNHHIPYLYVYAGAQWKTAAMVRRIEKEMYRDEPDGLSGNEDCGQMSAWYVMSSMGLYQVNPSNGVYVFGSPLFSSITMNLSSGKKFTVNTKNNSDKNIYIQSAKLNGKPYKNSFITYNQIMRGGTLEFVMGPQPNKTFGSAKSCRPVSAR